MARLAGALLAACLAFQRAGAATDTWTDNAGAGDSNWATPTNWSDAANAAPSPYDSLDFTGNNGLTSNNNFTAGMAIDGIAFDSAAGAFTLTGNGILLSGQVNNPSETLTAGIVNNAPGMAQTINLPLTLDWGSYTFTDPAGAGIAINGGLTANTGGVALFSGTGDITTSGGTALTADPNTGLISGLNGAGLILNSAYNTSVTSGSLALLPLATVSGGQIVPLPQGSYDSVSPGAIASGANNNVLLNNGSISTTYTASGTTLLNTIVQDTGTDVLDVTGTMVFGAGNAKGIGGVYVTNAVSNQDFTFNASGGVVTAGTTSSGGTIVFGINGTAGSTANELEDNAKITNNAQGGPVTIIKTGMASMYMNSTALGPNADSYSGGTYVDEGWLQANGPGDLGTGPVYIAGGATLYLETSQSNNIFLSPGTGDNGGNGAQGNIRFAGNSGGAASNLVYSGTFTAQGSPVTAAPGDRLTNNIAGGSLVFTNQITGAGTLDFDSDASNGTTGGGTSFVLDNTTANGNNWTGGTIMEAFSGTLFLSVTGSAANQFGPAAGTSAGNFTFSGGAGNLTFNPNGFNQTIGALITTGGAAADFVNNRSATLSTLTIGDNGGTGAFGGVIEGPLNITKTGTGTQTFSGANSYTGATSAVSGTLQITGAGTLGSTTSPLTVSGGTVDLGTTSQTVGAVTLTAANGTIQDGSLTGASYAISNNTGASFISANLLGGAGVTMSGSGSTTLSGNNTYSGATSVSAGTLFLNTGGTNNIAGSSGITISHGATLDTTNVDGGLGLSLAGTQNLTNNGVLNGSISTTAAGQTLQGSGSYSGSVSIPAGTLSAGALNTVGSIGIGGNLSVSGGLLDVVFNGATATTLTLGGSATFAGDSSLDLIQVLGPTHPSYVIFSAPGGLTGLTSGLLETIGRTTYSIDPTQLSANVLQIDIAGGPANLQWGTSTGGGDGVTWESQQVEKNWTNLTESGSADYFYNGDNVTFNDTNQGDYTVLVSGTVSPGSMTVSTTNAYTIGGPLGSIAGPGLLTKNGSGSLTLNGSNSYTGGVNLNAGALYINNAYALGIGTITIAGGTIDSTVGVALSSDNAQVWTGSFNYGGTAALNMGTGAVTLSGASPTITLNNGQTLTENGGIGDGGSGLGLTVTGNGTLALGGSSSYSGATVVNSPAALTVTGALGNTGVTVNSGATINLAGSGAINQNTLTVAGGTLNESVNNGISGSAGLTINNGANVNLGNSNNYTGPTALTSGTLNLNAAGAVSGGTITVSNSNGTLNDAVTNGISGSAGLTLGSGVTLTLAVANNYTGATNLNGATLNLNAAGAISAGVVTSTNGTITENTSNALGGSSSLVVVGGTANLSQSNNYTGNTTLSAGTLLLGSAGAIGSGQWNLNGGAFDNNSGGPITVSNAVSWGGSSTFVGSNNLTLSGAVSLGANPALSITTPSALLLVSNVVSGGTGFTLGGAGTMELSDAANSFTGNIVINSGTLEATGNGTSGGNSALGNAGTAAARLP